MTLSTIQHPGSIPGGSRDTSSNLMRGLKVFVFVCHSREFQLIDDRSLNVERLLIKDYFGFKNHCENKKIEIDGIFYYYNNGLL